MNPNDDDRCFICKEQIYFSSNAFCMAQTKRNRTTCMFICEKCFTKTASKSIVLYFKEKLG